MGVHHTLVNKTKKEYFDLGKFLRLQDGTKTFQIDSTKLHEYLYETKGDIIKIDIEDFEEDGYNEIEGL